VVFAATARSGVSSRVASAAGSLTIWARVRAALIAAVLLVQCTSALPDRRVEKRQLKRPEAARLVTAADRGLGALGLSPGRQALEDALLSGSAMLFRARRAVLAPFARFFRYTATHQQWGLFLLGTRECFRIHVDARTPDDRWVALYHALGPSLPRYEAVLRYRRVRGIYNPSSRHGLRPQYPGFVRAIARYVLEREPRYDRVRVRLEHLRIGDPGTPPLSSGFAYEHSLHRSEVFLELPGLGAGANLGSGAGSGSGQRKGAR
jgi:hypothetical protein